MAQVCSKCSHVNPPEAAYCYYDGAVLGGHSANGGPVNAGSAPFPGPFVFPNGQQCRNFDQLAIACQQHWSSAVDLLKQGFLASFLGGLGRVDLAMAAQEAARFPDQDRGLDQLLDKLPTQVLQKPKLLVEPTEINLGTLHVGTDRQFELHLRNQGMRLLYGSAVSDSKWLTLGDPPGNAQKLFQFGSDGTVLVQVRGQHLRAGNKPMEGHLVVESNGGQPVTISIRADVPAKPFREGVLAGAISPRQIAEKAKAAPKDAAPLFERGVVAAWFKENGWTYPVQGPSAAGLGAVQQFFEALGLATAPKVEVTEKFLSLRGDIGTAVQGTLEIKTQEKRPVYAHATADQDWLDVSKTILNGRIANIVVSVPNVPNRPGQSLQAKVTIVANGNQRFVVPVSLQVTGTPPPYSAQPVMPVQPIQAVPVMAVPVMPVQAIPVQAVPVQATPAPYAPSQAVMAVPVEVEANPFAALGEPIQAIPVSPVGVTAAPVSAAPVFDLSPPLRRPSREKTSTWVHLTPAILLLLGLIVVLIRDLISGGGGSSGEVDPRPRVLIEFDEGGRMTFGVTASTPKGPWKQLTYDMKGRTNSTLLKIDDKRIEYGSTNFGGAWAKDSQDKPLAHVKIPNKWSDKRIVIQGSKMEVTPEGRRSVWVATESKVEVTQTVEMIPGEPSDSGQDARRMLDTCLVRYHIENKDTQPHRVGLRFMLDTLIGLKPDGTPNDGVPFTVPGRNRLIDDFDDFTGKIPDFIQVLEEPNLQNPGVIAFLNPKIGGSIEPPGRVSLTRWDSNGLRQGWDIPLTPIRKVGAKAGEPEYDSAIVMYWNEQPLAPGAKREIGFTYGLGSVSATNSRLGVTVSRDLRPKNEFTVLAQVKQPEQDKEVTLKLPAGFELAEGEKATQTVPALGPGASNSPVTWRVIASPQVGNYDIEVTTNGGISQKKRISIRTESIF